MLHPSYTEVLEKINSEEYRGEEPAVNSRYSIVIATSKRARELIDSESWRGPFLRLTLLLSMPGKSYYWCQAAST